MSGKIELLDAICERTVITILQEGEVVDTFTGNKKQDAINLARAVMTHANGLPMERSGGAIWTKVNNLHNVYCPFIFRRVGGAS